MPTDYSKLTLLDETYLENTNNRSAFYHIRIYRTATPSKYKVAVTYGKIGTKGRTIDQGTFTLLSSAHGKSNMLVHKKMAKQYNRTKKKAAKKKTSKKSPPKTTRKKKVPPSLRRFSDLLLE